jgi:osmotically inducible protein OsmC
MPVRKASAIWQGDLKSGKGSMKTESGVLDNQFSFSSRFEDGKGTNPEELIGAAHAGCFSMALSHSLAQDGYTPERVETSANVQIEKKGEGFAITEVILFTKATIPNIDAEKFQEYAEGAKKNCPVSKALKGVEIKLETELVS